MLELDKVRQGVGGCATYLSDRSASYRRLVKLFKDIIKWPLEDALYDTLRMRKRMRSSLGMHLAHAFTQQSRKQICARGCPLSKLPINDDELNAKEMSNIANLDKSRSRSVHLSHKMVVPPNRTPSIAL
jgi:hypothetical protein